MDFLECCQKIISEDSSPGQGNYRVAEFVAELCEGLGLNVELHEEYQGGVRQANLVARPLKETPEDELLLQAPLDTIDPGSFGLWSVTGHNPYNPTIKDGHIYGLGVAQGKLDIICKLKAIESIGVKNIKKPFALAGTFGSVQGGAGAVRLLRKKLVCAKSGLIGGPSDLAAVHTAKGKATVEINVPFTEEEQKFRVAHDNMESSSSQSRMFMGQSESGDEGNAIKIMLRYMAQLPSGISVLALDGGTSPATLPSYASLEFDAVDSGSEMITQKIAAIIRTVDRVANQFKKHEDMNFKVPHPTLNIGMVRTRQEYVLFLGTCYIPPSVDQKVYEGWMEEIRSECEKVDAGFRITEYTPPFRSSLDSSLVKSVMSGLEELNLDYKPASTSSCTEANIFSRLGVNSVLFGAGRATDVSQIPDENVAIADLEAATGLYQKVLSTLCS